LLPMLFALNHLHANRIRAHTAFVGDAAQPTWITPMPNPAGAAIGTNTANNVTIGWYLEEDPTSRGAKCNFIGLGLALSLTAALAATDPSPFRSFLGGEPIVALHKGGNASPSYSGTTLNWTLT